MFTVYGKIFSIDKSVYKYRKFVNNVKEVKNNEYEYFFVFIMVSHYYKRVIGSLIDNNKKIKINNSIII